MPAARTRTIAIGRARPDAAGRSSNPDRRLKDSSPAPRPRCSPMHVILLWNYRNASNGMNLHPLRVKRVLHIRSNDAHVRAYRWDCDLVLITLACCFGVWLRHRELA